MAPRSGYLKIKSPRWRTIFLCGLQARIRSTETKSDQGIVTCSQRVNCSADSQTSQDKASSIDGLVFSDHHSAVFARRKKQAGEHWTGNADHPSLRLKNVG
jgi:hypothetical protein